MPIYEYKCTVCNHVFEDLKVSRDGRDALNCPLCCGFSLKVPSVTGYRRDHTVIKDKVNA